MMGKMNEVTSMGGKKKSYAIFTENMNWSSRLRDPNVDGGTILKYIVQNNYVGLLTGIILLSWEGPLVRCDARRNKLVVP
jgi:hypothetical protein